MDLESGAVLDGFRASVKRERLVGAMDAGRRSSSAS